MQERHYLYDPLLGPSDMKHIDCLTEKTYVLCSFGLAALRQSSNIFFTNGNYDPFIACGATVNISSTIIASVYGALLVCLSPFLLVCYSHISSCCVHP